MAAQVKKYDPNQYNFEDFAKTMNQNFAIERSQNGQGGAFGVNGGINPANPVNLGGTTNSQTLGNLGANGVGAVGVNAGGVGNLSGVNTVGQAKPLVGRDMFRGITNSFFDTLKANGVGTSMTYSSPLVPKTPEFSPTVQAGEGDVPESVIQVGEAIKNGYGYVNRNEYNRFELTDSNVDAVSEYLRERGFAESDIQEYLKNKNKLVYDYSYRENAGNNIGGAAVGGEAQVSQGGGTLSFEDWQSAYSIDPAVEYQNAQAQLDYEFKTWMSEYGARAEQLYQMGLSNSGVSDIYGANAYTAYVQASMDLKRAEIAQQAENKRAYQEYLDGIEAQQSAVTSAAFNSYAASYTPAQEQSVRVALAAQGLSSEQVESAIAQLNNYYNATPEANRPDNVASAEKVNAAFESLAESYAADTTADKEQRIRNMYAAMGWSQSEIDKLIGMLNGFAGVSGVSANDTLIKALAKEYEAMFKNGYTGSAEDIVNVRQVIEASENAQYVDQIIAQMNANLKERETATVDTFLEDIEGTDADTVDLSAIDELLVTAENQYGKDSDQYNEIVGTVQAKADEAIKKLVLSYPSNVNEFATRLGIDPELYVVQDSNGNDINWNSADEDQKRIIMDVAVTDLYKNNGISQEAYVAYMNKSISLNIREEKNTKGVLDVALAVKDLDLDNQTTNALLSKIYESISFRNFNWTGDYVTVKTGIGNDKVSFAVGQPLNVTEEDLKVNGITRSGFVKYGNHIYYCSYENKKIVRIEGVRGSEGYTGEYENILFDVLKSSKTIKMFSFEQKKQDVNVDTGKKLTENGVVNTKTITLPNGEVVTIEDNDISVK